MAYVEYFGSALMDKPIDRREVLRYMGTREETDEIKSLIDECIAECDTLISGAVCFDEFAVSSDNGVVNFGFCRVNSRDLSRNLGKSDRSVIFAATVGLGIDRLVAKYSRIAPARALCVGAIGNERVESLCDIFCLKLKEKYKQVKPRYSAGYGDLELSFQKDIFGVLNCTKNIGISLSESLLMTPSKSVTAVVGIESGEDT